MNWFQNSKTKLSVILTLAVMLTMIISTGASAAVGIVVNSNADDTVANDGACTLREAINNANSDSDTTGGDCAAGAGADIISFAADYTITLVGSQLPVVTSEMTITGNGAANTIIQADAAPDTATYRVLQVASTGNLTLDGVTVRHGHCAGSCATYGGVGGGILNYGGTLIVTDSTLSHNSASGFGGGGGIANASYRDQTNSFHEAMLTVTGSTLSGNSANGGEGGGISNSGTLIVTDSTLSGNSANGSGGGIYNHASTVSVTDSILSGNTANTWGGGIANNSGTVTVTNSTISGNSLTPKSVSGGGGIQNLFGTLTVTNSTISGNSASPSGGGGGGGIYSNRGTLTVTNSILSGNSSTTPSTSGGGDEVYSRSSIIANAFNIFGHSGQNNADAFYGFTPGASDFNATSDGLTPTALASILDTTLADNGGPTQTHALVAGSPAINFAGACGLDADQRGVARPQGACDAGAFENQPPVANNDTYSTNENMVLVEASVGTLGDGVLANDTDADTEPLMAVRDTWTTNGALVFNSDGSFTYTPNANFCGADSFTYHANDLTADSNIATVYIDVVCVNNAPVADNDSESTDEDTPVNVDVQVNDNAGPSNEDQTLITFTTTNPANGTATINLDETVTYAPNLNFHGTDTFDYVVCDTGDLCDTATVTITVFSVNDAPVADAGGSYEGLPNIAIALSSSSAFDVDGDALSYSWAVNSTGCTFSDATTLTPSLTCTTDGNYTVTLTVYDGISMTSDDASVTVISTQQGIEILENEIQSLVDDEILKAGQANGLFKPLDNAIRSLDKGNVEDACNQLNDFIVKVEDKTPTPLDAATAAELIDSAEAFKSSIGCQ